MGATTIAVLVVCALAATYLYVMALCYLADLYTQRKENLKQKAEKERKEILRQALDAAEMKRKKEEQRRRQLARERKQRGIAAANRPSKQQPRRASPAGA
jgi:uncharacterized membrane protein